MFEGLKVQCISWGSCYSQKPKRLLDNKTK